MNFNEYQQKAGATAIYPGQGQFLGLTYAVLGLVGEAGETAEQVKKTWRDDFVEAHAAFNELTPERKQKIIKELGDVLWYAAQLATELGIPLGDVAQTNIDKLAARAAANQLHGEGSDR